MLTQHYDFQCCDLLGELPKSGSCLAMEYDVCLDKGTYDAISLNPDSPQLQRARYRENIAQLLKEHGLLILTSCNWTEEELRTHFENSECSLSTVTRSYINGYF